MCLVYERISVKIPIHIWKTADTQFIMSISLDARLGFSSERTCSGIIMFSAFCKFIVYLFTYSTDLTLLGVAGIVAGTLYKLWG